MKEKETLLEVQKDGEILVLLGGEKLQVAPYDLATSCAWVCTAELEISENHDDYVFDVLVRNIEEGEQIMAMWILGTSG